MPLMPNEDGNYTQGEIGRMLSRIESSVERDAAKIDALTVQVATLVQKTEGSVEQLSRRVSDLEAWQTWAARLVLAAVITAVLAVVLVVGPPRVIQR